VLILLLKAPTKVFQVWQVNPDQIDAEGMVFQRQYGKLKFVFSYVSSLFGISAQPLFLEWR
jgi:hypothetical protein